MADSVECGAAFRAFCYRAWRDISAAQACTTEYGDSVALRLPTHYSPQPCRSSAHALVQTLDTSKPGHFLALFQPHLRPA